MKKISLKALRVDNNLSQVEVAEKIGMSVSGYRALEQRNGKGMKAEKMAILCDLYGIDIKTVRFNKKGE